MKANSMSRWKTTLWEEKEIEFLKNNYLLLSVEKIRKIIGKTGYLIDAKAKELGLIKPRRKDLSVGQKFHMLTIVSRETAPDKRGRYRYICQCDCGNTKSYERGHLVSGHTKSCGCYGFRVRSLPDGETSYRRLFYRYKKNAELRDNIVFDLKEEQFRELISQNCHYCGCPPSPYNVYLTNSSKVRVKKISQKGIDRAWINTNTVDRKDSKKGYTVDNCVPACWPCNETKWDQTYDAFIERAYKIVEFQEKKKLG